MATINEKMTALADEIRELSGTTASKSIDTMTSDINLANNEINSQTDLIAQIKEVADNLPEAEGGGGDYIQTCTVELKMISATLLALCYTSLNANNEVEYKSETPFANGTFMLNNVVCGTSIVVFTDYLMLPGSSATGTAIVTHITAYNALWVLKAPSVANEHSIVEIREDD